MADTCSIVWNDGDLGSSADVLDGLVSLHVTKWFSSKNGKNEYILEISGRKTITLPPCSSINEGKYELRKAFILMLEKLSF